MIPIILSNGKTIEVENESSNTDFVVRTESFAEIDKWKDVFTNENINNAEMEGETISDVVFDTISITLDGNKIRTDFIFHKKNENEIMNDRLSELEDAVNFLVMGGEE